jgi:hypothetical protein
VGVKIRRRLTIDEDNDSPLRGKDEVKTKLRLPWFISVSLDAMRSSQLGMTARYNFVLPDSAANSVNSSADSKPPPAGIPRAMRVSATGLLFKRSTM